MVNCNEPGNMAPMSDAFTRQEIEELGRTHDRLAKDRVRQSVNRVVHTAFRAVGKVGDAVFRSVPSDGSYVDVVETLSTDALTRLFTHRTCAIHVRSFVPRETCDAIADWMVETFKFQKWEEASTGSTDLTDMFYGVGLPVNAVGESRERAIAYFSQAVPTIQRVRAASKGGLAPVDKLRLELDELWPDGANIRVDPQYKRKNLVGLGRLMKPEGMVGESTRSRGIIHVDASPVLSEEQGLFSANVYLRTPARGGELDVWGVRPNLLQGRMLAEYLDQAFEPAERERTQQVLRERLPPAQTIQVEAGDLVIINAGRPHAVRGFDEAYRVTLQTFIDYTRSQPLRLFA